MVKCSVMVLVISASTMGFHAYNLAEVGIYILYYVFIYY